MALTRRFIPALCWIRMYMLLALWILLVTWLHVKSLQERKRGFSFYLPLMAVVYLGFLTHYYFAVYLFFLAAAMELYLLLERAEQKAGGRNGKTASFMRLL